ncbi:MAG: hypothetical protein U9M92_02885 [Patescibacteria group bacterium]|nr:hypothetical protein [Patescibacteria group bacterium]
MRKNTELINGACPAKGGVGMLEALISVAIIAGIILGLVNIFRNLISISNDNIEMLQAESLLNEGVEVVRIWRDAGWDNVGNLTPGVDYFFNFTGGTWATSTVSQLFDDKFNRRVVATEVYRDATDDIVSSGGSLDVGTRLFTVSVAWFDDAATITKSASFYLTDLL